MSDDRVVHSFKDGKGREWVLNLNVTAVKRVKEALDVDLLDIFDGELIHSLGSNPVLLVDVIYVVCKEQADAEEITDVDFGSAMSGDTLDAATEAFLEELVGFFPKQKRVLLRKALAKREEISKLTTKAGLDRIDGMDLEKMMEKMVKEMRSPDTTSGSGSGGTPES